MTKIVTLLADIWGFGCKGDVIGVDDEQLKHLEKLQKKAPSSVTLYKVGETTDVPKTKTAEEVALEASKNDAPVNVAEVDLTKTEETPVGPVADEASVKPDTGKEKGKK